VFVVTYGQEQQRSGGGHDAREGEAAGQAEPVGEGAEGQGGGEESDVEEGRRGGDGGSAFAGGQAVHRHPEEGGQPEALPGADQRDRAPGPGRRGPGGEQDRSRPGQQEGGDGQARRGGRGEQAISGQSDGDEDAAVGQEMEAAGAAERGEVQRQEGADGGVAPHGGQVAEAGS
jgi:hypothetical protein